MEYEDVKPGMLFRIIELTKYDSGAIVDDVDIGFFLIIEKHPDKFSSIIYRADMDEYIHDMELFSDSPSERWKAASTIWSSRKLAKNNGYRYVMEFIFKEKIRKLETAGPGF